MRYLRERHGGLSFFVGGDNIIAVVPEMADADYRAAIDHVEEEVGVELKVGVGTGTSPHDAGMAAKHALETCRHRGTAVERGG
jgi:GTP cyclohydrolase IIa